MGQLNGERIAQWLDDPFRLAGAAIAATTVPNTSKRKARAAGWPMPPPLLFQKPCIRCRERPLAAQYHAAIECRRRALRAELRSYCGAQEGRNGLGAELAG
jgi:hypothetical protein